MSTSFVDRPALPPALAYLDGDDWQAVTLGRSDASVWRVGKALFLKRETVHDLGELAGEARRLEWLATMGIPAPRVQKLPVEDGFTWLLTTALPGSDLTTHLDRPAHIIAAMASGLRRLHGLDVVACPFDRRLDASLASGAANVAAGRVDEDDFDDLRKGWSAEAVLAWLLEHRPESEDLVVTHGDATLPNFTADAAGFAGVLDCGRLGVADRWQDLALACRSIIYNCGAEHVAPFLTAYGVAWDAERYAYYCALDELF